MSPRGQSVLGDPAPASPTTWRNAAENLACRVAAMGLGLAIMMQVARQGPQVQGAFSLFVALEAVLVAAGSGIGLVLARWAARKELGVGQLRRALAAAVVAGVIAGLGLVLASRTAASDPYRSLWLLGIGAPFLLLAPTVSGLWMGQGRLVALNTVLVGAPALALGLLLLAPVVGGGLLTALMAWIIARAAVGLVAVGWTLAHPAIARGNAVDRGALRQVWRFVAMIAIANIVSLANFRATLFIVESARGLAEAGVYSVAVQVAELLWILSWAITAATYSRVGAGDPETAVSTTLRSVRWALGAAVLIAPVVGFGAWIAVPALLGEAYRQSLIPLACLLPGVAVYSAASALSAYYTQHRGHPHWAAWIASLSLGLTLAFSIWTVPRWGATGAALATSAAYLIAIGVALRCFVHDTGLHWGALRHGCHRRLSRKT